MITACGAGAAVAAVTPAAAALAAARAAAASRFWRRHSATPRMAAPAPNTIIAMRRIGPTAGIRDTTVVPTTPMTTASIRFSLPPNPVRTLWARNAPTPVVTKK